MYINGVVITGTSDYSSPYEAKLTKTLKKFTAKPVTQVCQALHVMCTEFSSISTAVVHII